MTMFGSKPATVDAAVAPLLKVLNDLDRVAEDCTNKIDTNHATITRLQAANTAADAERMRAGQIVKALGTITNPKE
jgi:prefoldin subunit 5